RLRLEENRVVFAPDPRAAVVDLRLRPPAEALRVGAQRITGELLRRGGRARRDEQFQVVRGRLTEAGPTRFGRLLDDEDGLTRAILTRRGQLPGDGVPQL